MPDVLDSMDKLQTIEGSMKDILLKLGVTEAQRGAAGLDNHERRRRLLKLTLEALNALDGGAAMSLEVPLSEDDRAVNALAHRMGAYVPSEYR